MTAVSAVLLYGFSTMGVVPVSDGRRDAARVRELRGVLQQYPLRDEPDGPYAHRSPVLLPGGIPDGLPV